MLCILATTSHGLTVALQPNRLVFWTKWFSFPGWPSVSVFSSLPISHNPHFPQGKKISHPFFSAKKKGRSARDFLGLIYFKFMHERSTIDSGPVGPARAGWVGPVQKRGRAKIWLTIDCLDFEILRCSFCGFQEVSSAERVFWVSALTAI